MQRLTLTADTVGPIARGHPWVYADGVTSRAPAGTPVQLVDPRGKVVAFGLADEGVIAVRVLGRHAEDLPALLRARIAASAAFRDQVLPRLQRTALVARGEWTASRAQLRDWLEIDNTATAVELELVRLQGTAAITRARLLAALGSALTAPLEATTAESLPTGVVR